MTPTELAEAVRRGDRRGLARAITLVESRNPAHADQARQLFAALGPPRREALRIGLSGTPGVGKSSFIESFGLMLTGQGLRLAVLAVDPSSAQSGGSILGDKTRMPKLTREPNAYIRPSPAGRHLGGVAAQSRAAVALCEAAGFDVILVETVGVGQSEIEVGQMTDLFALLLAPGGGDELQGVKRGILEVADLVLINKADGDLINAAKRTEGDYASALRLMRARPSDPEGWPKARSVSAHTGAGLAEIWELMTELADWRRAHGVWAERRQAQARYWFEAGLKAALMARVWADPRFVTQYQDAMAMMEAGQTGPEAAIEAALAGVLAPATEGRDEP